MTWTACTHKTYQDFTTGRAAEGRLVWRCSHCGRTDVWGDGWSYHGNAECSTCWVASIDVVACSDACAKALASADSTLRVAAPTKPTAATADAPERPPSNRGVHDEARKRKALEALERLTPAARAEVIEAAKRREKP